MSTLATMPGCSHDRQMPRTHTDALIKLVSEDPFGPLYDRRAAVPLALQLRIANSISDWCYVWTHNNLPLHVALECRHAIVIQQQHGKKDVNRLVDVVTEICVLDLPKPMPPQCPTDFLSETYAALICSWHICRYAASRSIPAQGSSTSGTARPHS